MLMTLKRIQLEVDYNQDGVRIGKGTIIEPMSVIYDNVIIGEDCVIATSAIIKSYVSIGHNTIIGTLCNIEGDNEIGNYTTIQSQCHITRGMKIGNRVFIGPFVCTTNTPKISHGRFGYPNTTNDTRYVTYVEDGARIGAGVAIAPNITIGRDSLIDMCALITHNVEAESHIRSPSEIVGKKI